MTQTPTSSRARLRITLRGRVQGVGMRPAIARLAEEFALSGRVQNTGQGVDIHIEGPADAVQRFQRVLPKSLPPAAFLSSVETSTTKDVAEHSFTGFEIAAASTTGALDSKSDSLLNTQVPQDLVVCDACRDEVSGKAGAADSNRRDYAITSCTNCGPRYTVVERMPYERQWTSMAAFPLCDRCQAEYTNPLDRRFHAQTNACPTCGPHVWIRNDRDQCVARGSDAISTAAAALRDGKIVAALGLGGYQLLADATCDEAVTRLRWRKRRPSKPLAVMVASLQVAEQLATLNELERVELTSTRGPILIVEARENCDISRHVSQGTLGLMLPTTPLHVLLVNAVGTPLVCTSGNREGEPLAYTPEDSFCGLADYWLEHDRPVRRPIDDSVVRVMGGETAVFRLGRGYAPLALHMQHTHPIVALGGHQKQSIAVSNGMQSVLGPHLGDMHTLASRERAIDQLDAFTQLYGVEQQNASWACDLHPDYFTSQWAEKLFASGASLTRIQHHHAHTAAAMLDHGWLDREVLGISMDGSGYGLDGRIWGGEVLRATTSTFTRLAHLRPFSLIGGETAVRQPWRVAVALLADSLGVERAKKIAHQRFASSHLDNLLAVLEAKSFQHPETTSAGRLFDGVAALVVGCDSVDFEGQAAVSLEQLCDPAETGQYRFSWRPGVAKDSPRVLDWRPMIRQLVDDLLADVPPPNMAMRFHRGLATAIDRCCQKWPELPVALTGGVFQNRVLVEAIIELFEQRGSSQPLGLPRTIPVNDGGLSVGQLVVAHAISHRSTN